MMKFAFRDWLTFEEAAKHMTAVAKQECPTSTIEDAVYKGALTAYFYTPEPIGLYSEDPSYYQETCSPFAEGPGFLKDYKNNQAFLAEKSTNMLIPITHYREFKHALKHADKLIQPIRGLTVYAESGGILGGFFDRDENDRPLSLLKVPHLILVARSHLDQLAKVPVAEWLYYRSKPAYIEAAEAVSSFTGKLDIITYPPAGTPVIDETIEQELTHSKPAAKPADPDTEKGLIGAQKALAMAVYLIADLSTQLDKVQEQQGQPASHRNGLALASGKPNKSRIAKRLEKMAKFKKITDAGFSSANFDLNIGKALQEIGPQAS